MSDPWLLDVEDVLEEFGGHDASNGIDACDGLSADQAEELLQKYGPNELDKEAGKSLWELILEQFDDTLVKILLAAAAVSFGLAMLEEQEEGGLSPYVEPGVILTILILNAIVGVWQESNAEAALEALKDLQPAHATVKRDGSWVVMEAKGVVPGDLLQVRAGEKIPADARLIALQTTTMKVEQSSLTGESVSAAKDDEPIEGDGDMVIQDKSNMLFSSTMVANGKGVAVVTATGMKTEVGKIQQQISDAAEEEEETPLAKKLNEFGDWLAKVIMYICIAVWAINYNHFADDRFEGSWVKGSIYYFKIAVALAVAAIPEGLPAVITTCLALGTRKMAKKNAIVRKLPSVETLGCTTVICSDKTGTLTENQMTVETLITCTTATNPVAHEVSSTKAGFHVEGDVEGVDIAGAVEDVAKVCVLCNEANIEWSADDERFVCIGEPTEGALKVLAEKIGHPGGEASPSDPVELAAHASKYWAQTGWSKVETLEFSRDRKSMSVLCTPNGAAAAAPPVVRTRSGRVTRSSAAASSSSATSAGGGNVLFVKGASEMLLQRCSKIKLENGKVVTMTAAARKKLEAEVDAMAANALRTLCLAVKEDLPKDLKTYEKGDKSSAGYKTLSNNKNFVDIEDDLVFVGLVGMRDPPRKEVASSISSCVDAGIRIIVITGDNQTTAEAICRDIGVFDKDDDDLSGRSFTGAQFKAMSEEEQVKLLMEPTGGLRGSRVFSRAEPEHKATIVKILKAHNEICAMTGDGVNDAPALKMADIGVAMGIAGTEVAKEASDMVLADDNFATVVSAVEEGRAIYNNMQAFIRYLISSNIGEVAAIFLTASLGFPEGLIPVQLLWVNLVTDGPPATALGFNPADADIMRKPPRKTSDDLITGWVFFRYMVVGVYVGFACVASFGHWYVYMGPEVGADGSRTTWEQLMNHGDCDASKPEWAHLKTFFNDPKNADMTQHYIDAAGSAQLAKDPCQFFDFPAKTKASTISLSVLVTIEMLNALNALSEDGSLLQMPPWANPYLLLAMALSFALHAVILYIPDMSIMFSVCPLDYDEWMVVMYYSMPVIVIDEFLKLIGRQRNAAELARRRAAGGGHEKTD